MTTPVTIGAAEIATALGLGVARVHAIIKDPEQEFPRMHTKLSMGAVWLTAEVEQWAQQRNRAFRAPEVVLP